MTQECSRKKKRKRKRERRGRGGDEKERKESIESRKKTGAAIKSRSSKVNVEGKNLKIVQLQQCAIILTLLTLAMGPISSF